MKFSSGLALAFLLAFPRGVLAVASTGNELLSACEEYVKPEGEAYKAFPAGECLGLISGVGALGDSSSCLREQDKFCLPNEITNGQLARVVVKHLKEHPERLHLNQVNLILEAFHHAFPCQE